MDDNYPNVGIVSQCDDQEGGNRDLLRKQFSSKSDELSSWSQGVDWSWVYLYTTITQPVLCILYAKMSVFLKVKIVKELLDIRSDMMSCDVEPREILEFRHLSHIEHWTVNSGAFRWRNVCLKAILCRIPSSSICFWTLPCLFNPPPPHPFCLYNPSKNRILTFEWLYNN